MDTAILIALVVTVLCALVGYVRRPHFTSHQVDRKVTDRQLPSARWPQRLRKDGSLLSTRPWRVASNRQLDRNPERPRQLLRLEEGRVESPQGLTVVDIPGHENFKHTFLSTVIGSKGIVFLVDSRNRQNIYKSALYLYDFLISKTVQSKALPLLIVSNFQDQKDSLSPEALKSELEKEM